MFRFFFLLVFFLFGVIHTKAQEAIVKKIRASYIAYNQKIAEAEKEGLDFYPPRFKITNVQNRPALGPVSINIVYFYDEHSNAEEAESYADLKNTVVLRKIVYTEGMPSYTDYKETLFDEKGHLLFQYEKLTGYECSEKRFYFDKGKLIKIKFNPITNEQCSNEEDFPIYTRYAGQLTKDDLRREKWIFEKAEKNKQTLKSLYGSTQ